MKIAIDIDDTLTSVDRMQYTEPYLKENGLHFNLVNPDANSLIGLYDWTKEDVTRFIEAGGSRAFLEAPLRKGARETILKWRSAGHKIIILTARMPEWFPDPAALSREQLERNQIPYDELVADVWEKGAYCKENGIDVLIDDNFEICKKAQELGVKAILFVGKFNLLRAKEIKYAGSNWEHISSAVDFILNPPRPRY